MLEQKIWLSRKLEDFRTGGGIKTSVRRFVQTVPFAAVGLGSAAFIAGEMGPAFIDLSTTSQSQGTSPQPISLQPLYTPEYGPEWVSRGVGIGIAASAVEAIAYPFVIGAKIREGELDEIPALPNIGHMVVGGLTRGFDHVVNFPKDFRTGGGREEMQSNLAIFLPGGGILGGAGGVGADAILVNNYDQVVANVSQEIPVILLAGGVGVGVALGSVIAAEVTANEARSLRRQDEGFTTPRSILRRRRQKVTP